MNCQTVIEFFVPIGSKNSITVWVTGNTTSSAPNYEMGKSSTILTFAGIRVSVPKSQRRSGA